MKTPVLETERLLLRPLSADDAESAFSNWTSDPDVAKFMRWELHKNVSETREWLVSEETLIEGDGVYNWGFVLKETGELIGSGGLVFIDYKDMYELGYNIMRKYWNQGLTTQFYCCHAKDNPASGKVMTKLGFRYQHDGVYYSWNQERKFESKEYLLIIE